MKGCLCIHCDEFVAASESVRVGKYRAHPWCQERSERMRSALTEVAGQIIADCEEDFTTSGRSGDVARTGHGTGGRRTTGACNAQAVPSVQQPPASPTNSASSDPLAVAVRMERAEAEVARLREALQMVQSYFWGTELPVMKEGDVQQFVEAALGKDGV